MIFDIVLKCLCYWVLYVYPCMETFKAISSNSGHKFWLFYWTYFGLFMTVERILWVFI